MDDNYIIVTINDVQYYITADRVSDLAFINNKLVNISNSSITLVRSFDIQTTYPRITCNAMSQCRLQSSSTGSYTGVTSDIVLPDRFNMNVLNLSMQSNIIIGLLLVLISLKLMWKK